MPSGKHQIPNKNSPWDKPPDKARQFKTRARAKLEQLFSKVIKD